MQLEGWSRRGEVPGGVELEGWSGRVGFGVRGVRVRGETIRGYSGEKVGRGKSGGLEPGAMRGESGG